MSFRTILIEKAEKINLDLNNIVVKHNEDKYWVNLDEVGTIVISDARCLVSLKLLTELCEKGINVLFTNASHMPVGALNTLYNHTRAVKKIIQQIDWSNDAKVLLWTEIVKNKINNQIVALNTIGKTEEMDILNKLLSEVEPGDVTNREGTVSRVYYKEIFGEDFKRFDATIINFCINYVYQIIRSKISQEIVSLGFIPAIGVFHRSEYNSYNLADDFIEPFRPIVDLYVYRLLINREEEFLTPELKENLSNILNEIIVYDNKNQKIKNCIPIYLQDLFNFFETGNIEKIKAPQINEAH